MKNLIHFFIVVIVLGTVTPSFAQEQMVIASGLGSSYDEARNNALRSALELAFGAFISSNTKISNDILQKDEICAISSGNIKKVTEVSKAIVNDKYSVLLKVLVSPEKLASFVNSKGMNVSYDGKSFAANVKIQKMNEKSEENSIKNLVDFLKLTTPNCFDFKVTASEPHARGDSWDIDVTVQVIANKNYTTVLNYIVKTFSSVCLNTEDSENRHNMGLSVTDIQFNQIHYKFRSNNSRRFFISFFYDDFLPSIKGNSIVRREAGGCSKDITFLDTDVIKGERNGCCGLTLRRGKQYSQGVTILADRNISDEYRSEAVIEFQKDSPWEHDGTFCKFDYTDALSLSCLENLKGYQFIKR